MRRDRRLGLGAVLAAGGSAGSRRSRDRAREGLPPRRPGDHLAAPAAAPGVSILAYLHGFTAVGRARVAVRTRAQPVVVQIKTNADPPTCREATYSAPARRNQPGQFSDKND